MDTLHGYVDLCKSIWLFDLSNWTRDVHKLYFVSNDKSPANLAMAAQIRAELSAKGWTQVQLAEKSGVNFETLKRVLKGTRDINVTQMDQLALAFGLPLPTLIERAVDRIPDFAVSEDSSSMDDLETRRLQKEAEQMSVAEIERNAIAATFDPERRTDEPDPA